MAEHTYNAPIRFQGTDEEREANFRTHAFGSEDRCWFCDCRPWGRVAEYPCGVEPPRADFPIGTPYMPNTPEKFPF